ncbi:MAG: hypothetical protein IT458_00085 [Planctomycetes bacterium]|nr:hypothetical protein [Planctomycetota bacterium]
MNPFHSLPLLVLCLLASEPRAAHHSFLTPAAASTTQDPQSIAAALAMIRSAPDLIDQGVDWAKKIDSVVKSLGRLAKHGPWVRWSVRYADGTVVYNKFRFYRDAKVVLEYFTGRSPSPDADAYVILRGKKVHIRYDRNGAREMVRRHGKIVGIGVSP